MIAEAISVSRAAWRVSCFLCESCPPLQRLRTSRRRTSKFSGFVLPSFPPALGFENLGQKDAAFSGSSLVVPGHFYLTCRWSVLIADPLERGSDWLILGRPLFQSNQ